MGVAAVDAEIGARAGPVGQALAAPAVGHRAGDRARDVVEPKGDAGRGTDVAEPGPIDTRVLDDLEPVERVIGVAGDKLFRYYIAMDMDAERDPLLSVRDAAARLSLVPSRVRALAEAGRLSGRKVGGQWVFTASDLDRWANRPRASGRPLSQAASLGLLFELSGRPAPWLDRVGRWKALHSQAASDPDLLVARSVRRAERIERRAHPSDLPRILAEPGVVRSGLSATADHDIDLVAPGAIEIYLHRARTDRLIRRYSLIASGEPNVIIHAVDVLPALKDREVMPLAVAIVDLLESGEPRAIAAARRAWTRLRRP